jgi:hypothetical protein
LLKTNKGCRVDSASASPSPTLRPRDCRYPESVGRAKSLVRTAARSSAAQPRIQPRSRAAGDDLRTAPPAGSPLLGDATATSLALASVASTPPYAPRGPRLLDRRRRANSDAAAWREFERPGLPGRHCSNGRQATVCGLVGVGPPLRLPVGEHALAEVDRASKRRRAQSRSAAEPRVGSCSGRDAELRRDQPRTPPPSGSKVVLRRHVRAAVRPPDLCDSYNRRRSTEPAGSTQSVSPPERTTALRSRLPDPRAYARPGSSTAATPVDLTAAIAQIQARATGALHDCSCFCGPPVSSPAEYWTTYAG